MLRKALTAVVMAGVAAAAGLVWRRLLARWEPNTGAPAAKIWPENVQTATPS